MRGENLKLAIINFMSICRSAWNKSSSTGRIFMKFDIGEFFGKSVEKIQV